MQPKEESNSRYDRCRRRLAVFAAALPFHHFFPSFHLSLTIVVHVVDMAGLFTALLPAALALLSFTSYASAQVTIYAQQGLPPQAQPTPCVGAIPCDGNVLTAVNSTSANVTNTVEVQLFSGGMSGLSIPLSHFFGFSLELSVVDKLSEHCDLSTLFLCD